MDFNLSGSLVFFTVSTKISGGDCTAAHLSAKCGDFTDDSYNYIVLSLADNWT